MGAGRQVGYVGWVPSAAAGAAVAAHKEILGYRHRTPETLWVTGVFTEGMGGGAERGLWSVGVPALSGCMNVVQGGAGAPAGESAERM